MLFHWKLILSNTVERSSSSDSMETWEEAKTKLLALPEGIERDDYLDELTNRVMKTAEPKIPDPKAASIFTQMLPQVRQDLMVRSVALAISVTASTDDEDAVDAIALAFRKYRKNSFLSSSLIDALSLLALRNPIARSEIANLIIRLSSQDSRYLLIKGAKVITRLDPLLRSPDLREKLNELGEHEDQAVKAEVSIQQAYLQLADTLLSSTQSELRQRLALTQAAFARASRMEEHRPDADLFSCLVEMILTFYELTSNQNESSIRATELYDYMSTVLATEWMPYYRSETAEVCITHILGIADALKRAILSTQNAEDWTNFDDALIELASLYALISSLDEMASDFTLPSKAYLTIAENIFVPQLGPILKAAVGRRRLAKVTEKYLATHGEDKIAIGLRAFESAVNAIDQANDKLENEFISSSINISSQIAQVSSAFGQSPEALLANFLLARNQGTDHVLFQQFGLGLVSLPIDRPELLCGNNSVHEVSFKILNDLKIHLGSYPNNKFARLITVVSSIVSFASKVFDDLPDYVKCQEDGGMGQDASEKDLQKNLFAWLRLNFNHQAVYELTLAGGRVDNGLIFPECRIPIEVKHEFNSIDPKHIQNNYLIQADIYAASSDRVSFLLILDLRDTQAKKHRKRIPPAQRSMHQGEIVSSYSWQDGFWVASLPADSQLPHAKPQAIIVGLIQGNRPIPSSTTRYSS